MTQVSYLQSPRASDSGPEGSSWKRWVGGPADPIAQQSMLDELRALLAPLLVRYRLPADFQLAPGLRLRRRLGTCQLSKHGPASIRVRCTVTNERERWRGSSAIVVTLLHELAHLRYASHGVRFWQLLRRFVDYAHAAGLYDPTEGADDEAAAGDGKLAGSAADVLAEAARKNRRARLRANRDGLDGWNVGDVAIILVGQRKTLLRVQIVALRQTRAEVVDALGRRYLVSGSLLQAEALEPNR